MLLPPDLRAVGEDKELQEQKTVQDALLELAETDLSAMDSEAVKGIFDTKVTEVGEKVTLGDACNTKFSPNLVSAASLFMSAITNPTGAVLSSLQLLMNDTGFLPPGLGLPKIDLDLGLDLDLPDLKLPSFDLKLDIGGGLNIGSMMDSVGSLLQVPPLGGCDVFLPDIGPGAELLEGKLPGGIKQGVSGGLANPMAALGNKFVKEDFDKLGNPIKVIVSKGVNATIPRIPIRTQANPAPKATFDYPAYQGPALTNLQNVEDDTVPPIFKTMVGEMQEAASAMKEKVEDPVFQQQIKDAAAVAKEKADEAIELAKPQLETLKKESENISALLATKLSNTTA